MRIRVAEPNHGFVAGIPRKFAKVDEGMGFFDFVKDAGKSLWGDDDAPEASAEAIEKEVADLGLDGEVKVEVDGDTVKIAGAAPSQEAREKLILAAGNLKGVAKVEE